MRKGAVVDIIDYYTYNPNYEVDFIKAVSEFFNCSAEKVFEHGYLSNPTTNGLFNEWLVFDSKMQNGDSPLVNFYENNPLNYSSWDLELYKELQNNEYGLFSIISSRPGKVDVESLQQKKIYSVREYTAAPQLKIGDTIISRVAKVGERYEFISTNIQTLDTQMTASTKKYFRNRKDKAMTPKDVYEIFYAKKIIENNGEDNENDNLLYGTEDLEMTPQKAERQAVEAFKKCGLLEFLSVKKVKKWIFEKEKNDYSSFPLSILYGLIPPDIKNDDMNFLIKAVMDLSNYSPHKALGGKSPFEMKNDPNLSYDSKKPRIVSDVIDHKSWSEFANNGMKAVKDGNMKEFLDNYDQSFIELLENKTTDREIYRLFANKGAALLAQGNLGGEIFLKMALQLNPKYEFAKSQLKRLKKGEFDVNIHHFLSKEMPNLKRNISLKKFHKIIQDKVDQEMKKDSAMIYFLWLKDLSIDFSKHIPPKPQITETKINF